MAKLVLYDLASKLENRTWSPNPWKTRMMLNFKGLDYDSVFLDFPEIPKTLESLGIEPQNDPFGRKYTVPALKFPDGTYEMNSAKIAPKLEALYPSPPLYVDDPLVAQVENVCGKVLMPLLPVILPCVKENLVREETLPWFEETWQKRLNISSIEQLQRDTNVDEAWEAARPTIEEMAALLKANGGPFLMGEKVSYADFYIAGQLYAMGANGMYERFAAHDPAFDKFYKACAPWFARDT